MLPGLDGFSVARKLRAARNQTPILMLTARDTTRDMVEGLNLGADDYLVKPFSFEILLARLRAVSRRGPIAQPVNLQVADLTLNPAAREVTRGGRRIALTRTEYGLLEMLMKRAGRVVTRENLIEAVWGFDTDVRSNTLDAFIRLLARKGGFARRTQTDPHCARRGLLPAERRGGMTTLVHRLAADAVVFPGTAGRSGFVQRGRLAGGLAQPARLARRRPHRPGQGRRHRTRNGIQSSAAPASRGRGERIRRRHAGRQFDGGAGFAREPVGGKQGGVGRASNAPGSGFGVQQASSGRYRTYTTVVSVRGGAVPHLRGRSTRKHPGHVASHSRIAVVGDARPFF